jgi:hypothetical protein
MTSTTNYNKQDITDVKVSVDEIEGIEFIDYRDESQIDAVMSLVGRDLSEPYSSTFLLVVFQNMCNIRFTHFTLVQSLHIASFCIDSRSFVFWQSARTIPLSPLPVSLERLIWKICMLMAMSIKSNLAILECWQSINDIVDLELDRRLSKE